MNPDEEDYRSGGVIKSPQICVSPQGVKSPSGRDFNKRSKKKEEGYVSNPISSNLIKI